jgi:hypothetical protein
MGSVFRLEEPISCPHDDPLLSNRRRRLDKDVRARIDPRIAAGLFAAG